MIFLVIILTKTEVPILIKYNDPVFFSTTNLILVQGNSLLPVISPVTKTVPLVIKKSLLAEIIRRESNGDPKACNFQYGCRAGMGLAGFISGTWNSTLDRMIKVGTFLPEKCQEKVILPVSKDKVEAIFEEDCHIIVADWLLRTDGLIHWEPFSGPYNLSEYIIER